MSHVHAQDQQRPCTLASAASQEPGATEFLAAISAQPTCATQAQHIAFALGERVLIQRQLVPSGSSGKPRLVHLPAGDQVMSICWLALSTSCPATKPLVAKERAAQKAQTRGGSASATSEHVPILLVGSSSGRLGAYSHLGTALWSVCPHDAPLLQATRPSP